MAIDDPYQKAKEQHGDTGNPSLDLTLDIIGRFEFLTGVCAAIRKHRSEEAARKRVNALIEALASQVRNHDSAIRKMESPEFVEALIVAVNESLHTENTEKARRFASILGHSLTSGQTKSWDEAAAYIRDVAQLVDADIEALRILFEIQAELLPTTDPNPYTQRLKEVLERVEERGILPDEFYSRCSRLNGFGLAIEVQRNAGRMAPGDHCFRITTRGADFISMIGG